MLNCKYQLPRCILFPFLKKVQLSTANLFIKAQSTIYTHIGNEFQLNISLAFAKKSFDNLLFFHIFMISCCLAAVKRREKTRGSAFDISKDIFLSPLSSIVFNAFSTWKNQMCSVYSEEGDSRPVCIFAEPH